jgi:hypothetical protein
VQQRCATYWAGRARGSLLLGLAQKDGKETAKIESSKRLLIKKLTEKAHQALLASRAQE